MRKLSLVLVLGICLFLGGCAGCELMMSDMKASTLGIARRVTLYANDGRVIRQWEGKFAIDSEGDNIDFVYNGKKILVTGTYIVEEL